MIISRTPYRISFFGGGTDYPAWFREHGGAVLATSINKYCYITCRFLPPFFEHRSRIVWSRIERVRDNAEIEHPVVRAALGLLGIDQGVEIHYDGDLPARSGIGSSSAFTVGLLNALYALKGERVAKSHLARKAIHIEQNVLKEHVGVQDQIETAHGGFNRIAIAPNGVFSVEPVICDGGRTEALAERLLMFYTGVARTADRVAKAKIDSIPRRRGELAEMQKLVDAAIAVLVGGDLDDFGRLLHETWQLKRSLSARVAPAFVDDIYARARGAGALGGKILGAGGGGFMIFYVRPEDRPKVLEALADLLLVPIEFEASGSQIIFYEPDRYSRTVLKGARFRRYAEDANGGGANGKDDGRP